MGKLFHLFMTLTEKLSVALGLLAMLAAACSAFAAFKSAAAARQTFEITFRPVLLDVMTTLIEAEARFRPPSELMIKFNKGQKKYHTALEQEELLTTQLYQAKVTTGAWKGELRRAHEHICSALEADWQLGNVMVQLVSGEKTQWTESDAIELSLKAHKNICSAMEKVKGKLYTPTFA